MPTAQQQPPSSNTKGFGAIRKNAAGKAFRDQWPELDEENWKWMEEKMIDPQTGKIIGIVTQQSCSPETSAMRRRAGGSTAGLGAVVEGGQAARNASQSWVRRNWGYMALASVFVYVLVARLLGER